MHNNRSRTVRHNKTLITAQKKKKRQTQDTTRNDIDSKKDDRFL